MGRNFEEIYWVLHGCQGNTDFPILLRVHIARLRSLPHGKQICINQADSYNEDIFEQSIFQYRSHVQFLTRPYSRYFAEHVLGIYSLASYGQ